MIADTGLNEICQVVCTKLELEGRSRGGRHRRCQRRPEGATHLESATRRSVTNASPTWYQRLIQAYKTSSSIVCVSVVPRMHRKW